MESKESFWTSLPGILTGIAGLLAAAGTIVGIVLSQGGPSHPPGTDSNPSATAQTWGDQANAICAAVIKNGSGYVASNPMNTQLQAAAQFAVNFQSVDDQLRKLPANGQEQATVTSLIGYWDQAITWWRQAIQAAQNNYTATYQQDVSNYDTLNTEGNNLANQLGAGTCASGDF